jgi:hypothetical protein
MAKEFKAVSMVQQFPTCILSDAFDECEAIDITKRNKWFRNSKAESTRSLIANEFKHKLLLDLSCIMDNIKQNDYYYGESGNGFIIYKNYTNATIDGENLYDLIRCADNGNFQNKLCDEMSKRINAMYPDDTQKIYVYAILLGLNASFKEEFGLVAIFQM